MFERFLKIRETYWDSTIDKSAMCKDITIVNLDMAISINYSKNKDIEGDYMRIVFENSSIVGMVVN